MTPCYSWWEVPYYLAGMKLYDLVAGSGGLAGSHFVSAAASRRGFPTLSDADSQGRSLKGTVMYYDGQFNDSRLCVALVGSAADHGATVSNYCRVEGLIRGEDGTITGARVRDVLRGDGRAFEVHARVVVNATGPFSDHVRQMADPEAAPIVQPSAGVHITLPDYYSPIGTGLIVPKTKDGRVVFLDLGSSHGSKVNGKTVSGRVFLNAGDVVHVGKTDMVFTVIPSGTANPLR